MNKPEGIIFDCDGCLLDSEVVFLKTVVKYLKKYEIDTSLEELIFVIGKPMTVIAQEIIEKFSLNISIDQLIKEERELFSAQMNSSQLKPMPGLIDLLDRCKKEKIQLAIASSSPYEYVDNIVTQFGIKEYFQYIISGEQVLKGKPNPDIYYLAQSKLGIPKERLVVIEDSYNGIQAGKSAGIYTIAYKGSMIEQDTSNADCAVYSYEQIEW